MWAARGLLKDGKSHCVTCRKHSGAGGVGGRQGVHPGIRDRFLEFRAGRDFRIDLIQSSSLPPSMED